MLFAGLVGFSILGLIQVQAAFDINHLAAYRTDLEIAGHLGGTTGRVIVDGNYAYLAQGIELTVLDITDPTAPKRISYLLLPGFITGLDFDGGYIYAGWERCEWWLSDVCTGGLKILDVSNPVSSFEIGSYNLPGSASSLTIFNKYVYILWKATDTHAPSLSWGGMKILDISNPTMLSEINSIDYDIDSEEPLSVAIANGYAYLTTSYLYTYDLTDPTAPILVDMSIYSGKDIVISHGYAYVVGCCGMHILSLADPAHPAYVTSVGVDGMTEAVSIDGNYAYLAETRDIIQKAGGGLRVIDVTNPAAPIEVNYLPLPYGSKGVAVNGNLAYIAEVYNGLSVADISTPTAPKKIGQYFAPGEVASVETTGHYVYTVADYYTPGSSGMWVTDVSNYRNPVATGGYYEALGSNRLTLGGSYAYVMVSYYQSGEGYFNNYLHVVDRTTPAQLIGVSIYPFQKDQPAFNLDFVDDYIYLAHTKRLTIIDAHEPNVLATTGLITATHAIYDVTVSGSYAYVADGGLRIFDIRDPAHPAEIGSLYLPTYIRTLAISDPYAYVGGGTVLHVVDISDKSHPTAAGSIEIASGQIYDAAATGRFVFLAAYDAGLRVIDATDPAHPFETAFYTPPQVIKGVETAGGYIYAAGWRSGLYILRYNPLIHENFLPVVSK
jgi:hypothetical protein